MVKNATAKYDDTYEKKKQSRVTLETKAAARGESISTEHPGSGRQTSRSEQFRLSRAAKARYSQSGEPESSIVKKLARKFEQFVMQHPEFLETEQAQTRLEYLESHHAVSPELRKYLIILAVR